MFKHVLPLATAIISLFLLSSCEGDTDSETSWTPPDNWAYQLQKADPAYLGSLSLDIVVMDYSKDGSHEGRYTSEEVSLITSHRTRVYAYVSIGEAEDYRYYWNDEWFSHPPDWLGPENPEWPGNYAVRYWDPAWKTIVMNYLDRIIEAGFSGVYLDRSDAFEYWSSNGRLSESEAASRMAEFIYVIKEYLRPNGMDVLVQNAERLIELEPEILDSVDGWAVEDLFYDATSPVDDNIVSERLTLLHRILDQSKPVLVVDYIDDGSSSADNAERLESFMKKTRDEGLTPYAAMSDRSLDELDISAINYECFN